jgi:site-specific DNA recombinase
MTKAVLIARVSTDDQAENGFSLAAQLDATRQYAEARGWEIAGEFVDDGVSGAIPFADRPAGARAWAMLKSGAADALICQNVDRLSRDVVDLLVTIRELLRWGVEVHCLDLGRVQSEYDIMLVIRGWQGSDERAKIRERTLRGKRQKLLQGMILGTNKPTYGYDFLRDERGNTINFTINDDQAAIVRLIFQWYTAGEGNGIPLSLGKIAERLTDSGIPIPNQSQSKRREWLATTIARILEDPTYKGQWTYTAHSSNETFIIAVPAIVDPAIWEAAQEQKERNSRKARRNAKHEYLLTGIIRCGVCGYSMTGQSAFGDKYRYYKCHKARKYHGRQCPHTKATPADILEAAVWGYFLAILQAPATFEADLRTAQAAELEAQEPKQAELATVTALIAEAEAEAAQLAEALTKARGIVHKSLEDRMTQLNARYEALVTRRGELEAALQQRLTDTVIQAALEFASSVQLGIENADNTTKRRIIDLFDARVTVKDGRAFLTYAVQTLPIELQLSAQTQPNTQLPHSGKVMLTVELTL